MNKAGLHTRHNILIKMRKLLFGILFVVLANQAVAQGQLILTSGKIISFMKIESRPDYLDVWDSFTWKKTSIPIDSVMGYFKYGEDDDKLYYKVPDYSGESGIDYQFLPPGQRGTINTYGYTVTFKEKGFAPLEYLYVQKGQRFAMLFPFINNNTPDSSLATFKRYLTDQPALLADVNLANYRPALVKELIARYNLITYRPPATTTEKGQVTFYRLKLGENKEQVNLVVGDKSYPFERYSIRNLNLPAGQVIKVCLQNNDRQTCTLIEPLVYFRTYYRISYTKKNGLKLQKVPKKEAFDDMLEIKKFKK